MSSSLAISVHLLPTMIPPGALNGCTAVAVDVLRATSVMIRALAAGCMSVIPCLEIEQALDRASRLPAGTAILGGERQGLPIEGFDLGNSPSSYTPAVCRGKTLVMTTTNGTRAILAARGAARLFIGAFANVGVTLDALLSAGRPVHVVCAGTDGYVSLEDTALAGCLAASLLARGFEPGNDETLIAAEAWDRRPRRTADDIRDWIRRGRGGRRVRAIGLEPDIADVAAIDTIPLVARFHDDDPPRILAEPSPGV